MIDKYLASGGQVMRNVSESGEDFILRDDTAGINCLIEHALTSTKTPGADDAKPYGQSPMAVMMLAEIYNVVSEMLCPVNWEFRLRQKIDDIVLSPRYFMKVTEALLNTKEFPWPVSYVVDTEANRVIGTSSKHEGRVQRFSQPTKKTASVRSWPSSMIPPTDISDNRTNKKAYSTTSSDEDERWKRKMESRNRQTRENQTLKKPNSAYKSGQITMLKVIEPVYNLFTKAADCRMCHLINQLACYHDSVVNGLYGMAKETAFQMRYIAFSVKYHMSAIAFLQNF